MEQKHLHPIIKRTFGDFDIQQEEVVGVSSTKSTALFYADEYNKKRTEKELEYEVEFYVGKRIKILE